jgi:hypothetical protein
MITTAGVSIESRGIGGSFTGVFIVRRLFAVSIGLSLGLNLLASVAGAQMLYPSAG